MHKKWLIILILLTISLTILLLLRSTPSPGTLTIQNQNRDTYEISLDFLSAMDNTNLENPIIANWYNKYKTEKGNNLLKIFSLQQIINITNFPKTDFTEIYFEAIDGARIIIQPTEEKDSIILLTLEKDNNNMYLRLILPEDNFSQRWLKNIVIIRI